MDFENTLLGYAYDYPTKKRMEDCPYNEIAHFPFKEKVIWIKGLNEEKKNRFFDIICFVVEIRI